MAAGGDTTTVTGGINVTEAEADLVVSAWLVAVTVTVSCVAMFDGAVYRPLALIVPTPAGLIDQVTALLQAPETPATNCCVCPTPSVAARGVRITAAGGSGELPALS